MAEFSWTVDDIERAQRDFSYNFMRLDCIRTESYDVAIDCMTECIEKKSADVSPSDRWVDARTNPPIATDGETSDYVLVSRADGRQCVCYYVYDNDEGNCWFSEDEKSMYDIDEVTHWQPLPEPPKGGDTNE